MSSFKRKGSKQTTLFPGTKISHASPLTILTSTGVPSFDDILGGGLPLSCSLLIAAPDPHSSYGELIQKYFIAEGLCSGHRVLVVDPGAKDFINDIMWTPGSAGKVGGSTGGDDEDQVEQGPDTAIKIAWRYENMKQFQTTVASSSSSLAAEYCHPFDLSCRIPKAVIDNAILTGQLSLRPAQPSSHGTGTTQALQDITEALEAEEVSSTSSSPRPLRICVPSLASPFWGDLSGQDVLFFLHTLRRLLHRHPHSCASISLPADVSTESWGGPGWLQKLAWTSDATLSLSAFTGNPSMSTLFPAHHGLLRIYTLPSPHTLLPPSDKISTLRGLASSSVSTGGSGENNLAFKCTRKRLIFETLHLDLEGGVGERRTTPSSTTTLVDTAAASSQNFHIHAVKTPSTTLAAVEVQLEGLEHEKPALNDQILLPVVEERGQGNPGRKKAKKKVAFHSDRPDLYDF